LFPSSREFHCHFVANIRLSWSDTTASTIGRLWGKYTAPLPSHFPGIRLLPFAPRKSLAGFLAATITGIFICLGFWWNGSGGRWAILEGSKGGLFLTAGVVGVGGAVVEALG
jgi:diacylglycerol kinase (CTP)